MDCLELCVNNSIGKIRITDTIGSIKCISDTNLGICLLYQSFIYTNLLHNLIYQVSVIILDSEIVCNHSGNLRTTTSIFTAHCDNKMSVRIFCIRKYCRCPVHIFRLIYNKDITTKFCTVFSLGIEIEKYTKCQPDSYYDPFLPYKCCGK